MASVSRTLLTGAPYYQDELVTLYHGDCRDVLPRLEDDSIGAVVTDLPYGVGKAPWDSYLPLDWMHEAARMAPTLFVMPGIRHLLRVPERVGRLDYRWTLAMHISNGMTRGAFGFGNWFPCLVYAAEGVSLHSDSQDAKTFAVRGEMPDHPSPKPIAAMRSLVSLAQTDSVLDPFAGSGTTLVAAKQQGLRAIGIEIEERYCETAARRLAQGALDFT